MHYCSVESISKSYGIQPLFDSLSFHINKGDRISLIAKNGTGKSTLLKILAGQEHPDEGKVWIHKEVEVVFLNKIHASMSFKQWPRIFFFMTTRL